MPAWDKAGWKGMAFGYSPKGIPFCGPAFENQQAAEIIFSEWQRNIGEEDIHEKIRVSIIESSRDGSDPKVSASLQQG